MEWLIVFPILAVIVSVGFGIRATRSDRKSSARLDKIEHQFKRLADVFDETKMMALVGAEHEGKREQVEKAIRIGEEVIAVVSRPGTGKLTITGQPPTVTTSDD